MTFPETCAKNIYFFKRRSRPGGSTVLTRKTSQKSQIFDSKYHRELDTPPLTAPLATPRDVVTRRAEGAIFKGNLKALAQYPDHLGQAFRPGAHEAGILVQNYLLAHLLKGGLHSIHRYSLLATPYWLYSETVCYASCASLTLQGGHASTSLEQMSRAGVGTRFARCKNLGWGHHRATTGE